MVTWICFYSFYQIFFFRDLTWEILERQIEKKKIILGLLRNFTVQFFCAVSVSFLDNFSISQKQWSTVIHTFSVFSSTLSVMALVKSSHCKLLGGQFLEREKKVLRAILRSCHQILVDTSPLDKEEPSCWSRKFYW